MQQQIANLMVRVMYLIVGPMFSVISSAVTLRYSGHIRWAT